MRAWRPLGIGATCPMMARTCHAPIVRRPGWAAEQCTLLARPAGHSSTRPVERVICEQKKRCPCHHSDSGRHSDRRCRAGIEKGVAGKRSPVSWNPNAGIPLASPWPVTDRGLSTSSRNAQVAGDGLPCGHHCLADARCVAASGTSLLPKHQQRPPDGNKRARSPGDTAPQANTHPHDTLAGAFGRTGEEQAGNPRGLEPLSRHHGVHPANEADLGQVGWRSRFPG